MNDGACERDDCPYYIDGDCRNARNPEPATCDRHCHTWAWEMAMPGGDSERSHPPAWPPQ